MIRKYLMMFIAVLGTTPVWAWNVDGIEYSGYHSEATVEKLPSGKYVGSIIIPEVVEYNGKKFTVTGIGINAFDQCTDLTDVSIPSTVTSIDANAFSHCSNLTELTIPKSVTSIGSNAFFNCRNLKALTLADGKDNLKFGANAFSATHLESLYVGRDFTFSWTNSSWEPPFYDKTSIVSLTIGNLVTSIDHFAFSGCTSITKVIIPESVTSIGECAFSRCTGLTDVDISNSVTSIGSCAFSFCSSLKNVTIPNSLTSISQSVFEFCSRLTEVTIPNSVTSIGSGAFEDCTSLKEVTIPNSVTSIGSYAFSSCNNLSAFILADGENCLVFGARVFYGSPIETLYVGRNFEFSGNDYDYKDQPFYDKNSITNLTISNSVTTINNYAFACCAGLKEVIIPPSVTTISGRAFYQCTGLKKFATPKPYGFNTSVATCVYDPDDCVIEDGVIFDSAKTSLVFVSMFKDGVVTIPSSVTTIGEKALAYCDKLALIDALPITAPSNAANSFEEIYKTVALNIPKGAMQSYLTTDYWYLFRNFSSGGEACTGISGGFKYIYDSTNSEATLTGIEDMTKTEVSIPSRVKLGDTRYNITAIGQSAFKDMKSLANLTLGENIKDIYANAFNGCKALASVSLPAAVTSVGTSAFENCISLTDLTLDDALTSIGDHAFQGCGKLRNVELPDNLTKIGDHAFYSSYQIANVTFPASKVEIGNYAFAEIRSLVNINAIKASTIGDYAFHRTSITSIDVKADTIGEGCFKDCTSICSGHVECPVIGSYAFNNCTNLTAYDFSSVKSIGNSAFSSTGLTEVLIPSTVESIGEKAFMGCKDLSKMTIVESARTITMGSHIISYSPVVGLYIGRNCSDWSSFKESPVDTLVIGNNVTEMGESAFYGCNNLRELTLGSGLVSIPASAFKMCQALAEVVIPTNVISIGDNAFDGCSLGEKIAIGCGVTHIGERALYGSDEISNVYLAATQVPVAYDNSFSKYNVPLYLPANSIGVYDVNPWSSFFDFGDPIPLKEINLVTIDGDAEIKDLKPGDSFKLSATFAPDDATLPYIFWRSTNPEAVTVDTNGNVTFLGFNGQDESEIECKIIAETMYANVTPATITIKGHAGSVETIIDNAENIGANVKAPLGIYNLQGICLRRNAADADVKALRPGIYIVNGRKVVIR